MEGIATEAKDANLTDMLKHVQGRCAKRLKSSNESNRMAAKNSCQTMLGEISGWLHGSGHVSFMRSNKRRSSSTVDYSEQKKRPAPAPSPSPKAQKKTAGATARTERKSKAQTPSTVAAGKKNGKSKAKDHGEPQPADESKMVTVGHAWIERSIRRVFPDHGIVEGTIVGWIPAQGRRGTAYWHVLYQDGEEENLEAFEIEEAMSNMSKRKSSLGVVSYSAEALRLKEKTAMKAIQDEDNIKMAKKVEKENAQLGVIVLESVLEYESEVGLFGNTSKRKGAAVWFIRDKAKEFLSVFSQSTELFGTKILLKDGPGLLRAASAPGVIARVITVLVEKKELYRIPIESKVPSKEEPKVVVPEKVSHKKKKKSRSSAAPAPELPPSLPEQTDSVTNYRYSTVDLLALRAADTETETKGASSSGENAMAGTAAAQPRVKVRICDFEWPSWPTRTEDEIRQMQEEKRLEDVEKLRLRELELLYQEDVLATAYVSYLKIQAVCATFSNIADYDPSFVAPVANVATSTTAMSVSKTPADFFKCPEFSAQPARALRDSFFFYCIHNRTAVNHQPFPGWHRGMGTPAVAPNDPPPDPLRTNLSQKPRKQVWYCSPEGVILKSRQDVQSYIYDVGDTVYDWDLTPDPTTASETTTDSVSMTVELSSSGTELFTNDPTNATSESTSVADELVPNRFPGEAGPCETSPSEPASGETTHASTSLPAQENGPAPTESTAAAGDVAAPMPTAARIPTVAVQTVPIISFSAGRRMLEKDFSFQKIKQDRDTVDADVSEEEWKQTTQSLLQAYQANASESDQAAYRKMEELDLKRYEAEQLVYNEYCVYMNSPKEFIPYVFDEVLTPKQKRQGDIRSSRYMRVVEIDDGNAALNRTRSLFAEPERGTDDVPLSRSRSTSRKRSYAEASSTKPRFVDLAVDIFEKTDKSPHGTSTASSGTVNEDKYGLPWPVLVERLGAKFTDDADIQHMLQQQTSVRASLATALRSGRMRRLLVSLHAEQTLVASQFHFGDRERTEAVVRALIVNALQVHSASFSKADSTTDAAAVGTEGGGTPIVKSDARKRERKSKVFYDEDIPMHARASPLKADGDGASDEDDGAGNDDGKDDWKNTTLTAHYARKQLFTLSDFTPGAIKNASSGKNSVGQNVKFRLTEDSAWTFARVVQALHPSLTLLEFDNGEMEWVDISGDRFKAGVNLIWEPFAGQWEQRRFMETSLSYLMDHPKGAPFNEPVDPTLEGCESYPDVVKKPMDLGTIESKLLDAPPSRTYKHIDEFSADVRLVFENCMLFNDDTSVFFKWAKSLLKIFEQQLKKKERADYASAKTSASENHGTSSEDAAHGSNSSNMPKGALVCAPLSIAAIKSRIRMDTNVAHFALPIGWRLLTIEKAQTLLNQQNEALKQHKLAQLDLLQKQKQEGGDVVMCADETDANTAAATTDTSNDADTNTTMTKIDVQQDEAKTGIGPALPPPPPTASRRHHPDAPPPHVNQLPTVLMPQLHATTSDPPPSTTSIPTKPLTAISPNSDLPSSEIPLPFHLLSVLPPSLPSSLPFVSFPLLSFPFLRAFVDSFVPPFLAVLPSSFRPSVLPPFLAPVDTLDGSAADTGAVAISGSQSPSSSPSLTASLLPSYQGASLPQAAIGGLSLSLYSSLSLSMILSLCVHTHIYTCIYIYIYIYNPTSLSL
jgi:hypothetical protein